MEKWGKALCKHLLKMDNERANYWLSAILIDSDKVTPTMIMDALEEENNESRPVWKPMHMQSVFEEYDSVSGEVSEEYFKKGMCLPSDTKMSAEKLELVINIIKRLWSK